MEYPRIRKTIGTALAVLLSGALAACGGSSAVDSGVPTLRLGYFPNVTHATAIVGVAEGLFTQRLGTAAKLRTRVFNAGPAAVEAIFSGAIDAAYIGPNPTINAFIKSKGAAIRVISGAASGGAALVVKPGITSADQLRGKRIATPQLGNTQDVALRFWLRGQGMRTSPEGGGDVVVMPQDNAQSVDTFVTGAIDGAWVPEPYVSRMVNAGGKILVDERDLWPEGRFVVTNLVVSTSFLKKHPDAVKRLLAGHADANALIAASPDRAQRAVAEHIGTIVGKPMPLELVRQAWATITFLTDPLASSLRTGLDHAVAVDLAKPTDLAKLYDLSHLNAVLAERGEPGIVAP
jgi:NitT/TauT family transport system substrate-binding protein